MKSRMLRRRHSVFISGATVRTLVSNGYYRSRGQRFQRAPGRVDLRGECSNVVPAFKAQLSVRGVPVERGVRTVYVLHRRRVRDPATPGGQLTPWQHLRRFEVRRGVERRILRSSADLDSRECDPDGAAAGEGILLTRPRHGYVHCEVFPAAPDPVSLRSWSGSLAPHPPP
jgi:hypothetical protein